MNTLQIVGSLALWAGGWLTIGILIGRRLRDRVLNDHIETALTLARAVHPPRHGGQYVPGGGGLNIPRTPAPDLLPPDDVEDTPLRRARTVDMPDRSRWGKS